MRNSTKSRSLSLWIIAALAIVIVISLLIWRLSIPTPVPIKREVTAEVKLIIGEPFAQMVKDSTPGVIDPAIPNETWYNQVRKPAQLHFNDLQYNFITPAAKFLTVGYDHGVIDSIRMSPQVDTLSLDEAMKVILNLQEQWRKGGWILSSPSDSPAYEDTPEMRKKLKQGQSPTTYWSAGEKYQAMIFLQKFADSKGPNEERYLITMAISTPWVKKNNRYLKIL